MREVFLILIKSRDLPRYLCDLNTEVKISKIILKLINDRLVTACHDVSDGGIIISVLEMCASKESALTFLKYQ